MQPRVVLLCATLLVVNTCQREASSLDKVKLPAETPRPQLRLPKETPQQAEAKVWCERLSKIKEIPFKDEPIYDEVYLNLIKMDKSALPCLTDQLVNTAAMKDPRPTPKYKDFRVGDMAYIMLVKIANVPFEQMLPEEVRERVQDEGVYAYFEYVEHLENRKSLRQRWKNWLTQTK